MKNFKYIMKLAFILLLFINNANAQLVGSGFNYQGVLNFNGTTVNTPQVFTLKLFDADTGGVQVGTTIVRGGAVPPFIPNETGIDVTDGLFSLANLDFGDQYSGDELWLEVTVKAVEPIACGGIFPPCPTPVTLSPRQRIHAVPYAVQADFISPNFDISIGTTVSTHRLTVKADTDNQALRLIGDTGTFGYGARLSFGDLPRVYLEEDTDDHLKIRATGGISLDANVKQPITSSGIMKYMVHASCGDTGSNIIKSYNAVSSGTISIANAIQAGRCTITFPDDISNRYMQVSPLFGVPGRATSCRFSGTNDLQCVRFNPSTLSGANGEIMILVY